MRPTDQRHAERQSKRAGNDEAEHDSHEERGDRDGGHSQEDGHDSDALDGVTRH